MITVLWILAYVANVFVARWFNKRAYQLDHYNPIWPWTWFVPFGFVLTGFAYLISSAESNKKSSKFLGRDW